MAGYPSVVILIGHKYRRTYLIYSPGLSQNPSKAHTTSKRLNARKRVHNLCIDCSNKINNDL